MIFDIDIIKMGKDDEQFVYYIYQFSILGEKYKSFSGKTRYKLKIVCGKLKIDKKNGDVYTLEIAEGDNGKYVERAGWALMRHWEKREFPDKTKWLS